MSHLLVAKNAAQIAGSVLKQHFAKGSQVYQKESNNLVTDADLEAEKAIISTIKKTFPDHTFFAEEEAKGDVSDTHVWIIDPLDGTNNFAHQIAQFSVSIAYYHDGIAQAGVVYDPIAERMYYAEKGSGAFCNDDSISVSSADKLVDIIVGMGFYYDRGAMMRRSLDTIGTIMERNVRGVRRFGSAALDLCMVAQGSFGAYFEYAVEPWDVAAGALIVQEAGGKVTDCNGVSLPIARSSILASNGAVHQQLLELVDNEV